MRGKLRLLTVREGSQALNNTIEFCVAGFSSWEIPGNMEESEEICLFVQRPKRGGKKTGFRPEKMVFGHGCHFSHFSEKQFCPRKEGGKVKKWVQKREKLEIVSPFSGFADILSSSLSYLLRKVLLIRKFSLILEKNKEISGICLCSVRAFTKARKRAF